MDELIARLEKARPFGDCYRVTEDGCVFSISTGKWRELRPTRTPKGYFKLQLLVDGQLRHLRLNQVICTAFRGPRPSPTHMARHLDDERTNNHWTNIDWGTAADNARDAIRNGRADPRKNGGKGGAKIRGSNGPRAKLTDEDVAEIKRLRGSGETLAAIAARFSVTLSNIGLICRGITWKI